MHKSYTLVDKRIEVLRGIDLRIHAGEKVSIMGKSGVGKSTFMHVMGTLDRPSSGKIFFEGRDVFKYPDHKLSAYRNQTIGFVFQFHYLLPDFTALENVAVPMRIARRSQQDSAARATEVLEQVGLGDRLDHKPGELSGGEQQRVAIARALVMNPKILLADEPTGNLDEQTSLGIHLLMKELNELYNTTLVVVTHDHRLADRMDRRLIMHDGAIMDRSEDDTLTE